MKNQQALLLCDFYKLAHRRLYPKDTELIYSTFTPRDSRISGVTSVVSFGQQAFIKEYLINYFTENFFNVPKEKIVSDYKRFITATLGTKEPETAHIEELHDLGYLPLEIKSIPEGMSVPIRVPVMTIQNTHPNFFWLTNYIETLISCELWKTMTSATIAKQYYNMLENYAMQTGGSEQFVPFQGHDFSMRGMSSLKSAINSGMGHLVYFTGTDTIPAICAMEEYYNADITKELVGTSIPATEHSIQCSYQDDYNYFKEIITNVHPTGFVSIVSDGYDFWNVVGNILPQLKNDIMNRDGRVVIRPDSGDPVKIVCGDSEANTKIEQDGLISTLWDIFGGTINAKGYKELDSHIGAIYGDSITLERARSISEKLKEKGFATTNIVYGIGSYTYQHNTRDTFGFAMKSTLAVINGDEKQIFKNPKTDNGIKKSQKGKVVVKYDEEGEIQYYEGYSLNYNDPQDLLTTIYKDGKLVKETTLQKIRGLARQ